MFKVANAMIVRQNVPEKVDIRTLGSYINVAKEKLEQRAPFRKETIVFDTEKKIWKLAFSENLI